MNGSFVGANCVELARNDPIFQSSVVLRIRVGREGSSGFMADEPTILFHSYSLAIESDKWRVVVMA